MNVRRKRRENLLMSVELTVPWLGLRIGGVGMAIELGFGSVREGNGMEDYSEQARMMLVHSWDQRMMLVIEWAASKMKVKYWEYQR